MSVIYEDNLVTLLNGDCIEQMEYLIEKNNKINKIITSPPYNIIRPNSKEMSRLIDLIVQECKEQEIETLSKEELKSIMEEYEKILNT